MQKVCSSNKGGARDKSHGLSEAKVSSFESGLTKVSRRAVLTGMAGVGITLATPALAANSGSFRALSLINNLVSGLILTLELTI